MKIRNYHLAESLEDAWQLNQKKSARILGGMLWMKMSRVELQTGIDLSGLGLDGIEETDDGFSIGCMTSLRTLETHEGFLRATDGVSREALRHIVGVQFRNCATVGGSVFGRFGFSDVLTLLMALDGEAELYKGGRVPLCDFAELPRDNDILVRVWVPKRAGRCCYQSVRPTRTDFPTLTCCARQTADGLTLVYGARPMRPMRLPDHALLHGPLTAETIEQIAGYAAEAVPTGSNLRGSAAYRSHLVRVLTVRVLNALGGEREC